MLALLEHCKKKFKYVVHPTPLLATLLTSFEVEMTLFTQTQKQIACCKFSFHPLTTEKTYFSLFIAADGAFYYTFCLSFSLKFISNLDFLVKHMDVQYQRINLFPSMAIVVKLL